MPVPPTTTLPVSVWPTSFTGFFDKVDLQDNVLAVHVNQLQAETLAIQYTIGLTPQGVFPTVTARLANYDAQMVTISGNQTITGTKAFNAASATGFRVLAGDAALLTPGTLGPLSIGLDGGAQTGLNNAGIQSTLGSNVATLNVQPFGGLTKFGGAIDNRPNGIQTDILNARVLFVSGKSTLGDVDFYLNNGLAFYDVNNVNRPPIYLKWTSNGLAFCNASGAPLVTITDTGDIITTGVSYAGVLTHSSTGSYTVGTGTTWVGPVKTFVIPMPGLVAFTASFGIKYFDEVGFSANFGIRVNGTAATVGPEAKWDFEPTGFILDLSELDFTAMTGGPGPADSASKVITAWASVPAGNVTVAPTVVVNSLDPTLQSPPSVTVQGFSIVGTIGRAVASV